METGINIESQQATVEAASAVAGAIGEILTIGGRERTPESVLLAAIDAVGRALTAGPTQINGCSVSDNTKVTSVE